MRHDLPYWFDCVDGGALDNRPVELVRAALAGLGGSNPRDPKQAHTTVLLLDPCAAVPRCDPPPAASPCDLLGVFSGLAASWTDGGRFSAADLLLALEPGVASRFLLTARREREGKPRHGAAALATAGIGGFLGFLRRELRVHDYMMGRENCRYFLMHEFVLHEDNPVFRGFASRHPAAAEEYRPHPGQSGWLPIVPVAEHLRVPRLLPHWPRRALDPGRLAEPMQERCALLLRRLLDGNGLDLPMDGLLADWVTARKLAGAAEERIRKAMASGARLRPGRRAPRGPACWPHREATCPPLSVGAHRTRRAGHPWYGAPSPTPARGGARPSAGARQCPDAPPRTLRMRAETRTTTASAAPERGAALPPRRRRGLLGNATWSAIDFWAQQATALLVFVLVGNMVGPAAVGLVTVAQLAVTLLMALLLDGFSDALVQRRDLDPEHFDTAFGCWPGSARARRCSCGRRRRSSPPSSARRSSAPCCRCSPSRLPFVGVAAVYQEHAATRPPLPGPRGPERAGRRRAGFATALRMARAGYGPYALVGYFLCVRVLDAALLAAISRRLPGARWSRRRWPTSSGSAGTGSATRSSASW